jgi:hypothetical protein
VLLLGLPVEVEGVHVALEAVGRNVDIRQLRILGQELEEFVAVLLLISDLALVD